MCGLVRHAAVGCGAEDGDHRAGACGLLGGLCCPSGVVGIDDEPAADFNGTMKPGRAFPGWYAAVLALALASGPALSAGDGAPPAAAGPRVYTRAVMRDLPAADAQPALIRLKIAPRGKLPFSTLTFRIGDRRLLEGIALGDEVGFIAERRAGENTVVALRKVAPCVRFQHCPTITD